MSALSYQAFIEAKQSLAPLHGFPCDQSEVNPILKPHQRDMVAWAVRGGRRAIFTAFGLGKTMIQLETVRITLDHVHKAVGEENARPWGLIIMPLGVRQEFKRDAAMLGINVKFIKSMAETAPGFDGIYLTNYESVREGKIDVKAFDAVSLDEASALRGFGGTKTFREFMAVFEGTDTYRWVATATPAPNEFIELLAYSAFLDVMDVGQAKTRFFKRNSEKADELTIHPHKEDEFWHWVGTWAVVVQKPSDLGHSDEGYELPPIEIHWHEVPSDHKHAGMTKRGQNRLIADTSLGVVNASREKRDSIPARIAKMMELREIDLSAHRVIWHDLEAERIAIEQAVPTVVSVYGSQSDDDKEAAVVGFSDGQVQELAGKPVMLGSGCNFQKHCSWAIFLGIGFKFNDFIQAIYRLQRFLQTKNVRIDLIYTEAERQVKEDLVRKWRQHELMVEKLTAMIREFGLSEGATAFRRTIGCERQERSEGSWTMVNNDCVIETMGMAENSVDLIVTSIPFSTQYEYSPSFNDFGHTDDNDHFWQQMGYLIPELLRVLKPGRDCCVHVKDRIVPGGINKLGFQTVYPFSDECSAAFRAHGFAALGRRTVVTDVVRENAGTYRLGWTKVCKDSSAMGSGMPEYVLVFRKPQSDTTKGFADDPVTKEKRQYSREDEAWSNDDGYSRARWQFDAHGFWKSSGDRLLSTDDLTGKPAEMVFKLFRQYSGSQVYDHEHIVKLAEHLEQKKSLPSGFMLLQPVSNHPDVWTDVARMRSLNSTQTQANKENHICPLPFDIVERLINLFSNPGDVVFDPFAGIGTVPYCAVNLGRKGLGCELNPQYFGDACWHLKRASGRDQTPTLFDLAELEAAS